MTELFIHHCWKAIDTIKPLTVQYSNKSSKIFLVIFVFHGKHFYLNESVYGTVSLCQRTNCQCDNLPTFVLHNSFSVTTELCSTKVGKLSRCPGFFVGKVKPPPVYASFQGLYNIQKCSICVNCWFVWHVNMWRICFFIYIQRKN